MHYAIRWFKCKLKPPKNWKEEDDNMHHKHMFPRFAMKMASSKRPTEAFLLDSEQKIKTQLKQFGLRVVSKRLENDIK